MKANTQILFAGTLAASVDSAVVHLDNIEKDVRLAFTVEITDGAGAAPTSTPVGTWALLFSFNKITWFPIENTDVATEMTRLNATGNNLIRKAAIIHNPPGTFVKAAYTRSSGGGAGTVCDLWVEVAK